jgi:biopolymer transport protein TolR
MKFLKMSLPIFYTAKCTSEVIMRPRSIKKRPISEINVVPYIDVMLVLLVIFMITAPLLTQGVNVNLPQAHAKAMSAKDKTPIVVSVNGHGEYFLNLSAHPLSPISPQQLMSQVSAYLLLAKEHHEKRPVYVKGDRDVQYGRVVKAMVMLQKAGAEDVGLITEPQ